MMSQKDLLEESVDYDTLLEVGSLRELRIIWLN